MDRPQLKGGFSINKRMLTTDKSSMSIDTLKGLRLIKDAVHGKATDVCITQKMIQFCKAAHSKYRAQKEAEKKTVHKNVNPVEKKKTASEDKLEGVKENISSAQSMIDEGNKRLQTGLKRACMTEITSAQALIEAGCKKLKLVNEKIKKDVK